MENSSFLQFEQKVKKDPYANFLGIKLDKVEKGYARVSMVIKEDFCNFLGYIHGGVIFSLADQAFAAASNSRGVVSLALQMSISYIRAPSVGDTLIAEAKEEHVGSKIGLYQIKVMNSSNQLIAEAQGIVYRKQK
ncbi:hotdog fold thioesterase [Candidatus Aerophobetes bacterium]|nr:hotdog fold thioesterase [Candidatus Aerophobetes bacterium]